jgi:hypothetical protein
MSAYRFTLSLFLLFSFVQPAPALAQARENIVLLPVEVSPEYANQKKLIGVALRQSLSRNFNVFYGDSVEAALQAEYAKEDCSAESCVQNIAILFNGEIVVDASVQRVENSAFLSVQFRNVITGELEAVVQDACRECSFTQLIDFINERASDIALNSSQGLTALLEKQANPLTSSVATPQRAQPKPSVTVSQEPINPRPKPKNSQPKVAKSPSYWKWGLGALALAAGGGGGGGGGGSDGSGGSDVGNQITPTTLLPNPITWTANNTDLLGQSKRVVFTHPSDFDYANSVRHTYNLNPSAFYGLDIQASGMSDGFDFEIQLGPDGNQQVAKFDYGNGDLTFDIAYGDVVGRSINGFSSSLLYFIEDYSGRHQSGYAGYNDAKIVVLLGKYNQQYPYDSFQHHHFKIEAVFDEADHNEFTHLDVYSHVSGEITAAANRPTSGSTVFNGWSVGHYTFKDDGTSKEYFTQSEIQATIDWTGPQNIVVRSVNTEGRLLERLIDYSNYSNNIGLSHLDFSTNAGFTNYNQDAGSALTGQTPSVSHSIMGPSGEEVAGTFYFTSDTNGKTGYVGAFGAVQ